MLKSIKFKSKFLLNYCYKEAVEISTAIKLTFLLGSECKATEGSLLTSVRLYIALSHSEEGVHRLTGGGTLQTGRCCPLKTTEHPGTCCVLHAGMCWPVQSGIPCGATVVTV